MPDLAYQSVSDVLLSEIPEFRDGYQKELDSWQPPDKPGQYIVFGFVVQPVLKELLATADSPETLQRIFNFFERMACSSDIEVPNLLQIEIFEWLVGDAEQLATAWKYMGQKTKEIALRTARIRRCEMNLPKGVERMVLPTSPIRPQPLDPEAERQIARLWPNRQHESNWLKNFLCRLGLHRWSQLGRASVLPGREVKFCRWCTRVKVDGVEFSQ